MLKGCKHLHTDIVEKICAICAICVSYTNHFTRLPRSHREPALNVA